LADFLTEKQIKGKSNPPKIPHFPNFSHISPHLYEFLINPQGLAISKWGQAAKKITQDSLSYLQQEGFAPSFSCV